MCEIITLPMKQTLIQRILDQLDMLTKLNVLDILNQFALNVLSIFDVIISSPVDNDIKCIIISIIFTDLGEPVKYYTSVNKKWVPFCVSFGKTCNYLLNFDAQENVMKTIMNHFITTKMDKSVNIMCISKSFAAFILHNDSKHTCANFTFLAFDRKLSKLFMCAVDKSTEHCCTLINYSHATCPFNYSSFYQHCIPGQAHFELRNMYMCDVIFYSSDNRYTLGQKHKNQLINKVSSSQKAFAF